MGLGKEFLVKGRRNLAAIFPAPLVVPEQEACSPFQRFTRLPSGQLT